MYREFYSLDEKPFALLPDPRFMYLGSSHREALAHVLYGIEAGEGFIEVIGQVGTGKTTLCRTLLDRLGPDVDVAFIFNPSQNELELLQSIHREFSLSAEGKSRAELVDELNEFLLKTRAASRRAVIVIDEAQNLTRDVLEQLRLISNLETEREKLVQIVLIGQPELDDLLARPDLRQLRQRITVRWIVRPFDRAETEEYVSHRLRVAGRRRGPELFTRSAFAAMHRASRGTPRLINAIADRSLLAGYAARKERIDAGTVRRAIREMVPTDPPRWHWLVFGGAFAACAGLLFAGWHFRSVFGLSASGASAPIAAEQASAAEEGPAYSATAIRTEAELLRLGPALLARPLEASASEALNRVLKLWGISTEIPAQFAPDEMGAVLRRVSNLRLNPDRASLLEIRALDQPVILEFEPKPGELRYAVFQVLLDGELAGIAAGDQLFALSLGSVQRYWTGRALFVWRNFESLPTLTPGDARPGVREMQASLTRLGYMKAGDPTGEYDARTEAAVRKFQQERGLAQTGQFDFKTMIALYGALDQISKRDDGRSVYGGPHLSRAPERGAS